MPAVAGVAREAARRQRRRNERERGLIHADERFVDGDWHGGCQALDRVLADHPRDALALQVGHLMDFFRGDALNLRNRISRVLPHWDAACPATRTCSACTRSGSRR